MILWAIYTHTHNCTFLHSFHYEFGTIVFSVLTIIYIYFLAKSFIGAFEGIITAGQSVGPCVLLMSKGALITQFNEAPLNTMKPRKQK